MAGSEGTLRLKADWRTSEVDVRYTSIAGTLHLSVLDLFKASYVGMTWDRTQGRVVVQQHYREWARQAALTGGNEGSKSWEGFLCLSVGKGKGEDEGCLWTPLHGLGGVMWSLVQQGNWPDKGEDAWKERVQNVTVKAREGVEGIMQAQGQPGGTQASKLSKPLLDSGDSKDARLSAKWQEAAAKVKEATGVVTVQDDQERSRAYGRTLNKLLEDDPLAREEALECKGGLLQSAKRRLRNEVEGHCVDILHSIKNSFMCSWAHLQFAAVFMVPLLVLMGVVMTPWQAVTKVKKLVDERKTKARLQRTSSGGPDAKEGPSSRKVVPGVGFDPGTRFEAWMSCAATRATMRMPKGKILICLSFDERTLAKVWWSNTLVGIKFAASPNHSRKDDYHNIFMYDSKECAELLAVHGKVGAACHAPIVISLGFAPIVLKVSWTDTPWSPPPPLPAAALVGVSCQALEGRLYGHGEGGRQS